MGAASRRRAVGQQAGRQIPLGAIEDDDGVVRHSGGGAADALFLEGHDDLQVVAHGVALGGGGAQRGGGVAALDPGEHVALGVDVQAVATQQVGQDRGDGERPVAALAGADHVEVVDVAGPVASARAGRVDGGHTMLPLPFPAAAAAAARAAASASACFFIFDRRKPLGSI